MANEKLGTNYKSVKTIDRNVGISFGKIDVVIHSTRYFSEQDILDLVYSEYNKTVSPP
jgi:enoyl-[acyl-carrier-protein] reductase (NADH)